MKRAGLIQHDRGAAPGSAKGLGHLKFASEKLRCLRRSSCDVWCGRKTETHSNSAEIIGDINITTAKCVRGRSCNVGFTLLELMIAIFILAMSMTILLGTESTSMRLMGYANNTSVVTMLTRSKMQDIEYEVQRTIADEGVKEDYVEELSGDFGDEGYDDIYWTAKIQSIELSDDASNNFVESVTNQIYGTGDEGGTLSGNTTITQFLPMMVSFLPTIINQLGQRIRKITLTTSWDYLGVEQTLTVSQFVVVLEVDAASGASGSAVSGSGSTDDAGAESTESDSSSKSGKGSKDSKSSSGKNGETEYISGKTAKTPRK